MVSQTKDFEEKIRKRHSLPEAIVIDFQPIGYPFYVLNLDLTYLANRNLELLEEYIMKCIVHNLNKLEEIAGFLGIDNDIVEKVLSKLISDDIIIRDNGFRLTEKGQDALQQQTILSPLSDSRTFYLDGLSGKLIDNFSLNKFDVKKYPNNCLDKVIKKPRKDNIEDILDYYQDIERHLQNSISNKNIELIQVNKIEKVYREWHEVLLVLYKSNPNDSEIEYEIFSRNSIQKDYRETIEKLYGEGKKILDPIFQDMKQDNTSNQSFTEIFSSIKDEDIKNVEQINAKISSLNDPDSFTDKNTSVKEEKQKLKQQLEQIKTQTRISEVIHTTEIREYLFKALKEAKNRVMIVSPWIKSNVVNQEFLSTLEETLKRRVQINIIYGYKETPGSMKNDIWSINQLHNLMHNYKNLNFQKTANSHRKQIVCDDKFAIVTSFNFLSFRADPNLTYRDELGVVLRDKQTIEDLLKSAMNLVA
jgi:predicted transcriptional regulator